MFRFISFFLAAASTWAAPSACLLSSAGLPVYRAHGHSKFTGIAKARREKRRRKAARDK